MTLNPRQRPKRPPRDEKKSTHVILAPLSISEGNHCWLMIIKMSKWVKSKKELIFAVFTDLMLSSRKVTYDRFLAKEEVHHRDVLLPGIVACLQCIDTWKDFWTKTTFVRFVVEWWKFYLSDCREEKVFPPSFWTSACYLSSKGKFLHPFKIPLHGTKSSSC